MRESLPFGHIAFDLRCLKRNIAIIKYSDVVLAFWDGKSNGTKFVIDNCKKHNIPVRVFTPIANDAEFE